MLIEEKINCQSLKDIIILLKGLVDENKLSIQVFKKLFEMQNLLGQNFFEYYASNSFPNELLKDVISLCLKLGVDFGLVNGRKNIFHYLVHSNNYIMIVKIMIKLGFLFLFIQHRKLYKFKVYSRTDCSTLFLPFGKLLSVRIASRFGK